MKVQFEIELGNLRDPIQTVDLLGNFIHTVCGHVKITFFKKGKKKVIILD